jgi:hypothetical protein
MQAITTIGLDIAKSVFQVHGVDAGGHVVIRRQLKRRYVLAFFEKLAPCLIGIEACASLHHWSRASHQLSELRGCTAAKFCFVPVLFAALLDYHSNMGPAEIPAKRRYTFQDKSVRASMSRMIWRLSGWSSTTRMRLLMPPPPDAQRQLEA